MQHFSIWLLTICLVWIDIVPLFCDVTIIAAVSLASELSSLVVSGNRTHSAIDDLLKMSVDNPSGRLHDDDEYSSFTILSNVKTHQNQNKRHHQASQSQHQHYHHHHPHQHNHLHNAKKSKHWNAHYFRDIKNHDRHHHSIKPTDDPQSNEWRYQTWQSYDVQPNIRRRHEKRWHHRHNNHQFIGHTDPITSQLHADLEIQSSNRMLDGLANETENAPIHWPVKKEAIMEGDLILGGLMMVHSRG